MEFCPGGDLFDKISAGKAMTENLAKLIIHKILRALLHCHKLNVVHRDIKPENIMYDRSGEVKLIDFGLAKQASSLKKLQTVAGTPQYIAPDVINGNYNRECDIWSVGVLLFVLITHTYPFDSPSNNITEIFSKI